MTRRIRWKWFSLMLGIIALGALGFTPGCGLTYIATQGYYQGKLLLGRIPVEEALARADVSDDVKEKLHLVHEIRSFGEAQVGLTSTQNYTTINLDWKQEIYNVSACRELRFEAHTWWFPIVGRVPYKGFFRRDDAVAQEARLKEEGYDTVMRQVGGYSTLGWFKDPILPHMLRYSEASLANLVLHELAHATLFVSGEVDFNESFATFVGNRAAFLFLQAKYGADAEVTLQAMARYRDKQRFNQYMHDLFGRLEVLYLGDGSKAEKRAAKAVMLEAVATDYAHIPFESEAFNRRSPGPLNNADLLQYRRYRGNLALFEALFEQVGSDMAHFLEASRDIARGKKPPFELLRAMIKRSE